MLKTMITAMCPACRGRFRVMLRHRSKRVKCPYCAKKLRVPISTSENKP
jgi:hypothetical protein